MEMPQRDNSFRFAAAHRRTALLKDKLEVQKVEVEGRVRYTLQPLEFELPFDKGLYVFVRAIQKLTRRNEGIVLVGLAGPSGSGKTAFSEKVLSLIPGAIVLSMDNYNDGSKVVDGNFDDPRITDYEVLLANVRDLRDGKSIQVPIYDFKQSKRVGYRQVDIPDSRVVILEGIYALSARLRPLLDLRVSITGGVHFDLVKRVLRDINRSGQGPHEIIQQITDTVYPMYKAFIEPDLKTAQIRVYNTFNPFAGFMNATYILKSSALVTREQVKSVLQLDHSTRLESETYDIYLLPPGEDPETCQSWLRMRNRDGKYNLMFEEWVTDGPFVISPRVQFEVSVRILGGLLSLGYEISVIMKRTSEVYSDDQVTIKFDNIEGIDKTYVQLQGKNREVVMEAGAKLGLEGTYLPRSYIELVQLEKLTAAFQQVTEDMKRKFAVDGETVIDDAIVGSLGRSPTSGLANRTLGFAGGSVSGDSSWPQSRINTPGGNAHEESNGRIPNGVSLGHAPERMAMDVAVRRNSLPPNGLLSMSIGQETADRKQQQQLENWAEAHGDRVERAVTSISHKVDELVHRDELSSNNMDHQIETLLSSQQQLHQELSQLREVLAELNARFARIEWFGTVGIAVVCGSLATLLLTRLTSKT